MAIVKGPNGAGVRSAIARGSASGITAYVWQHYLLPLAIPLGAPAVTALLGWAQGVQWMWVWLAALASPFFVLAGMREFQERRTRNSVEDKFSLQPVALALDIRQQDGKRVVTAVQARLRKVNKASFAISSIPEEIQTRVDGYPHMYRANVLGDPPLVGRVSTTPGESEHNFQDRAVEIPAGIDAERFYAFFRYAFRYGLAGDERHTLKKTLRVEVVNKQGHPIQMFFSEVTE